MTTQFRYVRDKKNPQRVMVIAREVDKNSKTIYYGYAVCMPKDIRTETGKMLIGKGDTFNKMRGREMAEGRMKAFRKAERNFDSTAGTVPLEEGQHPSDTLMKHLSMQDPRAVVRRMAWQVLDEIRDYQILTK